MTNYYEARSDHLQDILAAILAIPKHANGLRVPKASIHAHMGDRVRSKEDPITGDIMFYLEPAR
jgi:hypothetical protein